MTAFATLTPLVAAPFVGSFLGVLVTRLPAGITVVRGRSRCPRCGATLSAADLLPFLSWAFTGGACRHCGRSIDVFYPAIEAAALMVAVTVTAVIPSDDVVVTIFSLALGWMLLALAWIDLRHLLLPDALTLPLTVVGFAATVVIAPESLLDHALATLGGWIALAAIAAMYRALRKRPGLGGGDPKLMAAAGAWLGSQALPTVLLIACLVTLAIYALRMATRHATGRWSDKLPLGPGLAAAIWVVWLIGPLVCRVC